MEDAMNFNNSCTLFNQLLSDYNEQISLFENNNNAEFRISHYQKIEASYKTLCDCHDKIKQYYDILDPDTLKDESSNFKTIKQKFTQSKQSYEQLTKKYDSLYNMQVKEQEKAKKEENDDDVKNDKVLDKQGDQINLMLKLNKQDNQTNIQTFKTLQEQTKELEIANKNIQKMKKDITISSGILRNISCKELYYKLALMVLILLLGAADIWLVVYQLGKNFKSPSA
jgi:hypothetical protein